MTHEEGNDSSNPRLTFWWHLDLAGLIWVPVSGPVQAGCQDDKLSVNPWIPEMMEMAAMMVNLAPSMFTHLYHFDSHSEVSF